MRVHKDFAQKATHTAVPMNTIELKAEDIYDKEKVDLEDIVIGDVFKLLQCDDMGLSSEESARRLELFGLNKLESEEQNPLLHFLSFMWNPLSWVLEAAAFVAIALSNGNGEPPDWEVFTGIVLLLFVNATIGFYEERDAGNAIKALMDTLAPKAKVMRDGTWSEVESAILVPGDMISFSVGDIIPADCRLTEAINVFIDQAALTGESLPQNKNASDNCFSGSTCKQGEGVGIVISTGRNTFFGRAAFLVGHGDIIGHLEKILAQIGSFCLVAVSLFVLLEILILYPRFHFQYRRGLENILVLLIGGIPISMPTVLSVTLAVGAQQLAKHKAIVTRVAAIEELAGVTILCCDKKPTLTTNRLTVDKEAICTYGPFAAEEVILLAAYASRIVNQDAIDTSIIQAVGDVSRARDGITLLDFQPFDPVNPRTEITYREESSGKLRRVTKGMVGTIFELCTRNNTEELENRVEDDVEAFATHGLRALAVAYEELDGHGHETEGNGFEFIGLLPILDPPRDDTRRAINDTITLGVKVKMVTDDQLAIAKEVGLRIGLGDDMYPRRALEVGPLWGGKHASFDEMIMDADGFAGVFPEQKDEIVSHFHRLGHLCAITGDGANDAPALSRARVGIAVEGATDAVRGTADIVLTEPGLSTIVHAIRGSRLIFQRMRSYSIYACAVAIRIVVCFAILVFAYQFEFPSFMILVMALLNDSIIVTLSADCVLPSMTPDSWDLTEIFSYSIAYGLYLTLSTVTLVVVVFQTTFFQDTLGASLSNPPGQPVAVNDPQLHMIVYLQVSIISQALIFVTRSHGFFFRERPSYALVVAFCIAQLVSSIIAAFGNWSFANIHPISGRWIGIVWVWNLLWFIPLDWIKFSMKATVIKYVRNRSPLPLKPVHGEGRVPMTRTQSRAASIQQSSYCNRVSFIKRAARKVGLGQKVFMQPDELQRFVNFQIHHVGSTLTHNPSRSTG